MSSFKNQWRQINHYSSITSLLAVPGIYIWGFRNEEGFMPYYVGKAWKIADRLCNHLSNIKGGSYTIYTWEDLFRTDINKMFYHPNSIENRIDFIKGEYHNKNYNDLQKLEIHINKMIANFYYTYAEMSAFEFIQYGSNAEKTILNILKDIIVNTRIGKTNCDIEVGNMEIIGSKYLKISPL